MASAFANFLSFILPSKPPTFPSTPPAIRLATSPQSQTKSQQVSSYNFGPLVSQQQQNDELLSAICPSLAYANTLFCDSGYNVEVIVEDENEHEERLIGRFRREVMKAGVIQEAKRRRFFENSQEEKKRKMREAAKRNRRRRFTPRDATQNKQDASATKKIEDDDNWEMPKEDTL